jgi:O-antigen ligase
VTALPAALAGRRPAEPARARAHRATLPDVLELGFAVLVLLLLSEAFIGPFFIPRAFLEIRTGSGRSGCPSTALSPWLRSPRVAVFGRVVWGMLLVAPLILLAVASTQWSISPDVTLRRSIALAFTTLFGLYLAARFDWRDLLALLASVFLFLAAASFVAVLVAPGWAIESEIHVGAWVGLWYEKNTLGNVMAYGTLASLAAAAAQPARRKLWLLSAALCIALVLFSTSKTSLVAVLIVLAGVGAIAGVRQGGLVAVLTLWAATLAALVAVGVLTIAPELVLSALGKDPRSTGRTDIWAAVMRRVEAHDPLGHGYGAFWELKEGSRGLRPRRGGLDRAHRAHTRLARTPAQLRLDGRFRLRRAPGGDHRGGLREPAARRPGLLGPSAPSRCSCSTASRRAASCSRTI